MNGALDQKTLEKYLVKHIGEAYKLEYNQLNSERKQVQYNSLQR